MRRKEYLKILTHCGDIEQAGIGVMPVKRGECRGEEIWEREWGDNTHFVLEVIA